MTHLCRDRKTAKEWTRAAGGRDRKWSSWRKVEGMDSFIEDRRKNISSKIRRSYQVPKEREVISCRRRAINAQRQENVHSAGQIKMAW